MAAATVFVAALALRLVYLHQAEVDPLLLNPQRISDSLYYHQQAKALSGNGSVAPAPYFLAPLYHIALGLLYACVGPSIRAAFYAQAVIGALSCALLCDIGRRVFSPAVGWIAGFALAFYGLHIYYTGVLLPEILILLTNLVVLRILTPMRGDLSTARCLAGGLALGIAIVAKPNAILLGPLAAALVVQMRGWAGGARCVAGLALGTALAVTPVGLRNYLVSDQLVLISTNGGRTLWKGNGPYANGTHVFLPAEDQGTSLSEYLAGRVDSAKAARESREFTRRTIDYALDHPGRTLALAARKLELFFNATELGINDDYYFAQRYAALLRWPLVGFGLVAPLGIAGLVRSWRRHPESRLIHALFAVQVASFVIIYVLARYRLVAVACLALFAAWQLMDVYQMARARRWTTLAGVAAAVALLAVIVNRPLPDFPRDRARGEIHTQYGHMLFAARRYAEAVAHYEQARASGWSTPSYLSDPRWFVELQLAEAQARLGRRDDARETLRTLLDRIARAPSPPPPGVPERAHALERALGSAPRPDGETLPGPGPPSPVGGSGSR